MGNLENELSILESAQIITVSQATPEGGSLEHRIYESPEVLAIAKELESTVKDLTVDFKRGNGHRPYPLLCIKGY